MKCKYQVKGHVQDVIRPPICQCLQKLIQERNYMGDPCELNYLYAGRMCQQHKSLKRNEHLLSGSRRINVRIIYRCEIPSSNGPIF